MGMGEGMIKTHEQIKHEVCGLIDNYWKNIESAFVKSGYELAISIKVELGREDGANTIVPVLEFYPEKKTKFDLVLAVENRGGAKTVRPLDETGVFSGDGGKD